MSIKSVVPATQASRARTPSPQPMDKTAQVAHAQISQNSSPASADLKTKKFTWKTPFISFLSLITSLLNFLMGNNPPNVPPRNASITPPPAQIQATKNTHLETLLSAYAGAIRKAAPAAVDPRTLESLIEHELSKLKKKSADVPIERLHEVALGEKNLKRIRNKLTELVGQQRIQNSSSDLTALLKHHFTDEVAAKIFEQIYPRFAQKAEAAFSTSEGNPNSKIAHAARELINETVLSSLQSQMEEGLIQRLGEAEGKKMAAMILSDPEIIGEAIACNRAILTKEKRDEIVKKARLVLEHYPQFNEGLQAIKKDLAQGLPPDRKTFFKKYPEFEKALAFMPAGKKEEFERVLSEAWVKNRLKKLRGLVFSPIETSILKSRGFKITPTIQKQIRECMALMLESFLQEEHLLPYEQLTIKFEKWALDARLKYIKVPDAEIEKFKESVRLFSAKMDELLDLAFEESKKFKLGPKFPKAEKYLREIVMYDHLASIEEYLTDLLARKPADESKLIEAFKKIPEHVQAAKAWFQKYGSSLHSEFAQGEDNSDEILGGGVCAALCARFLKHSLESPTASTDDLAIQSTLPQDRKLQAIHKGLKHFRDAATFKFPPETLAQLQLEETQKLALETEGKKGDQEVQKCLTKVLQETKNDNGCFYLGWGGHATALRFDPQNNKFVFFEPNYGTFEFKRGRGETLDQLASRMATAYVELYQWAYPDREIIAIQQFSQRARSRV